GLLDDAIIDYKHLLNADNTFVNGHIALARLYLNKRELDLAEKECDMVLSEFEPDNLQALSMLSTIYEQKRKYDEAIVLLERILEKKPNNRSARIQLGLLYLRLSKFDEALAEAEYVSKDSPTSQPAAAYFIKGSVWLQRRDYEKAVTVLKEATLRLPNMAESHYFLAHAYVGLGRTQEAINEFKTTINVAPTFLPAKLGLARLLSRIGGWQRETVRQCTEILEIKPDHVEALQLLGMAYIKEQDLEKAETQFKEINKINPSLGEINMAYLSLVSGQLSKCIRQCEEIVKTNPNETRVYNILGLAHIRRGAFDSGIEQYKKVLEINPKSVSTLINIAKAYVVTEKNDEAKDALKNVITVDPNNLPSRNLLSGIYKKEGDIDEAAKLLEQSIEINPDYVGGYTLAGIYLLQGRVDESIDLCNRAIK
ncbi:MAG: tetratricopeptide repeat protein, partial [Gammaproteobacteria bacterium]|nr:tetratricopeptide repeat protein [Gammaproteobacteria bacterium]